MLISGLCGPHETCPALDPKLGALFKLVLSIRPPGSGHRRGDAHLAGGKGGGWESEPSTPGCSEGRTALPPGPGSWSPLTSILQMCPYKCKINMRNTSSASICVSAQGCNSCHSCFCDDVWQCLAEPHCMPCLRVSLLVSERSVGSQEPACCLDPPPRPYPIPPFPHSPPPALAPPSQMQPDVRAARWP